MTFAKAARTTYHPSTDAGKDVAATRGGCSDGTGRAVSA